MNAFDPVPKYYVSNKNTGMKWRFSINDKDGFIGTLGECQEMLAKHVARGYDNTYSIVPVLENAHFAYYYNAKGECVRIEPLYPNGKENADDIQNLKEIS